MRARAPRGTAIAFIGEAKARDRRPGLAELRRLEHVRDLLTASGHDASNATLGLFGSRGFSADLTREARSRPIVLAGLEEFYADEQTVPTA